MFSSNDKLIEVVLKRLIKKKKNNYDNIINQKSTNNIKVRRLSTLLARGSADKKRFSISKNKNILEGNKMNLKIVPLIKRRNILLKLKNFNEMIFNTESVDINNYEKTDKIIIRKPKINNLNINTFSNFVCTSDSFRKIKNNKKKHLFLSHYQVGLNKTKLFKNMVNLSKDIHSPKKREENCNIKKNLYIRSFSGKNGKYKNKDIFGIPKTFSEKKLNIKTNIFNYSQKVNSENKNRKKAKNKCKGFSHRNEIIKNIIKDENKRKANCYYNKLHLIKMSDIIDKYSYNNKDL